MGGAGGRLTVTKIAAGGDAGPCLKFIDLEDVQVCKAVTNGVLPDVDGCCMLRPFFTSGIP